MQFPVLDKESRAKDLFLIDRCKKSIYCYQCDWSFLSQEEPTRIEKLSVSYHLSPAKTKIRDEKEDVVFC